MRRARALEENMRILDDQSEAGDDRAFAVETQPGGESGDAELLARWRRPA